MGPAPKNPRRPARATAKAVRPDERILEAGKRAGSRYLDDYERLVERVITVQQRLAEQSNSDAVKSIVGAQGELTRRMASAYSSTARKLIS